MRRHNSRFWGVFHDPANAKPWTARVVFKGKRAELGRFERETDAAMAVDAFTLANNIQRKLNLPSKGAAKPATPFGRWKLKGTMSVLVRQPGTIRCTTAARLLSRTPDTVRRMKQDGRLRDPGQGFVYEEDVAALVALVKTANSAAGMSNPVTLAATSRP